VASIKSVSTTIGQSSLAGISGVGWYRYGGGKPEKPDRTGPLPQNVKASTAKQRRMAEYTRRRLDGESKEEAARQVGISASTMNYYERAFRFEHPEVARDA
jgi:DNA-binding XRE family transcriptional regulator